MAEEYKKKDGEDGLNGLELEDAKGAAEPDPGEPPSPKSKNKKEYKPHKAQKLSESTSESPIMRFLENIEGEFKRVTWPSREKLAKQTAASIVITVIIGLLICGIDIALNTLQSLFAGIV
ncbi:MAG: preprotein translocase subunit SecE [Clostridiales bacterium]|jgi:preprotein translocase subunit SecE|nr:preprotein translocase subunit SecE [Clostridiales bacterium]